MAVSWYGQRAGAGRHESRINAAGYGGVNGCPAGWKNMISGWLNILEFTLLMNAERSKRFPSREYITHRKPGKQQGTRYYSSKIRK